MKKIALLIAFTFLSLAMCTAEDKEPELIDITGICSAKQFDKIVDFILQKGQTKNYCSRYSNNPYCRFGDISVYLNPKWQRQAKERSTYSSITFMPTDEDIIIYLDIWKSNENSKVYTKKINTSYPDKVNLTTLENCVKEVLKEVSPKKWDTPK